MSRRSLLATKPVTSRFRRQSAITDGTLVFRTEEKTEIQLNSWLKTSLSREFDRLKRQKLQMVCESGV